MLQQPHPVDAYQPQDLRRLSRPPGQEMQPEQLLDWQQILREGLRRDWDGIQRRIRLLRCYDGARSGSLRFMT